MKYEDEFDGLLKDALSEVREAEPRMGLEGRVLAGVRAGAGERRVGWWKWVVVAAMVVVIVLGIAVRRGPKVDVVRKSPERVVVSEKKVEEARSTVDPKRSVERRKATVKVVRREAVSRTEATEAASAKAPLLAPRPMNDQEKALMLLARSNPDVLESVSKEQQGEGRNISPIEIEPIRISGIGEKAQ